MICSLKSSEFFILAKKIHELFLWQVSLHQTARLAAVEAADRSDLGLRPREQRVLRRKMHDNELFLLDFNVDLATSEDNGRRSPVFTLHHIRPDAVHEDILAAFDAINALRELHFLIYCSISCILETLHIVRGATIPYPGGGGEGGGVFKFCRRCFFYISTRLDGALNFFSHVYIEQFLIYYLFHAETKMLILSQICMRYARLTLYPPRHLI